MSLASAFFISHRLPCASLCLLLLIAIVSVSQTPAPTVTSGQLVKVEYDSNKNFTQISLNPFVLASRKLEELRLGAITGYAGKTKTKPKDIVLIILSLSHTDENRYDVARKLMVVVDGKRLDWGETQRSKQSQNGLFVETMIASVPMDDFLLMSRAKSVKIRIGLTEVELSASQIDILRLTASYLTE